MKLKLLACVICCLATLCLGATSFPLCMYGVTKPDDLKTIKKAGFSCIQTYLQAPEQLEPLARTAQKLGLKVVFHPNKLFGTPYEQKAQTWPVLAWYLVDEPDVARWSRARVIQAHQVTKRAFPNQPTALVIGQGKTQVPYYDIPDVMMVDWYPVPHYPLTSFGEQVRYTKEGMAVRGRADGPLWGVVQIFDWKNYKQYRPDNDRVGRFPTEQEIRFMAYDGIINGATGLFFFTFGHLNEPMPKSAPHYWARVKAVVTELARFKKIAQNGIQTANPVTVTDPLKMKSWLYKGHTYSVLLNTSAQEQTVPQALRAKAYKHWDGKKKTDTIPPYAVWVLKN